jgi:two-component system NtrC family response regulator
VKRGPGEAVIAGATIYWESLMSEPSPAPAGQAAGLPRVLVVDDDEEILRQIQWALSGDYQVLTARDRQAALQHVRKEAVPVVLLDLGLPPRPREASEGLRALDEILADLPLAKVIIVSGNSERANARLAVERGAYDVFPKPVDIDELKVVIRRVCQRLDLEREVLATRRGGSAVVLGEMIGSSPRMQAVFATVQKVAATDISVLIAGESGTGKELVATAIHRLSARREAPFVAINCAAIPEGLLESELFGHEAGAFTGAVARRRGKMEFAERGTLFLDEIGELAPGLQAKLLRFLQEKVIQRVGGHEPIRIDARVVAATNQGLARAVKTNRFREDLFFRLAVVQIHLPPLRDRGDDIIELAERLAASISRDLDRPLRKFSAAAIAALRRHRWPGNVRELENRLKRALLLAEGSVLGVQELELTGPEANPNVSLKEAKEELEKEMVGKALRESGGNISRAARALGVSRPTLYDLIARYGLGGN